MVELIYSGDFQPKGKYDVKEHIAKELIKNDDWNYANLVEKEAKKEAKKEVVEEKPIAKVSSKK